MSSKEILVHGQDWILERGTDEDLSASMEKRLDPADLSGLISIMDIYKRETGVVEHENSDLIEIINDAINMLPERERSIIRDYYFTGLSNSKIRAEMGLYKPTFDAIKARAMANLHLNLRLLLLDESEKDVYPDCPLCTCSCSDDLNVFMHLWVDYHRGTLKGLAAAVSDRFGPDLGEEVRKRPSLVSQHIRYHLNVDLKRDKKRRNMVVSEQRDQRSHQFNLVIDDYLKGQLEELALKLGRPQTHILRECATLGLPMMKAMVEMKDMLTSKAKQLGVEMLRNHIETEGGE